MEGKMTKFQMIAADLDLDYGFDELQCQRDWAAQEDAHEEAMFWLTVDDDDGLERELQMEVDAGYEEWLDEQADQDEMQRMMEAA
jgi:hypothetical protein